MLGYDETRVESLPRTGQVQNRKAQGSDKWTLLWVFHGSPGTTLKLISFHGFYKWH
jgi:hypothetical protein